MAWKHYQDSAEKKNHLTTYVSIYFWNICFVYLYAYSFTNLIILLGWTFNFTIEKSGLDINGYSPNFWWRDLHILFTVGKFDEIFELPPYVMTNLWFRETFQKYQTSIFEVICSTLWYKNYICINYFFLMKTL